ncbi:MAG: hypothetical protein WD572_01990 [Gammaproteobacteria bacterium]
MSSANLTHSGAGLITAAIMTFSGLLDAVPGSFVSAGMKIKVAELLLNQPIQARAF